VCADWVTPHRPDKSPKAAARTTEQWIPHSLFVLRCLWSPKPSHNPFVNLICPPGNCSLTIPRRGWSLAVHWEVPRSSMSPFSRHHAIPDPLFSSFLFQSGILSVVSRYTAALIVVLQCYDTAGWVIWPVKSSPKWPYDVSSGTLNNTGWKFHGG